MTRQYGTYDMYKFEHIRGLQKQNAAISIWRLTWQQSGETLQPHMFMSGKAAPK